MSDSLSKTAQKHAQKPLKELAAVLLATPDDDLDALSLPERLRTAVANAKRITAHGALRRQRQLVAKLLRDADVLAITAKLSAIRRDDEQAKSAFKQAERWRDRLLNEGRPALEAFAQAFDSTRTNLEPLLNQLWQGVDERSERHLRRQVFRIVHGAVQARLQSATKTL